MARTYIGALRGSMSMDSGEWQRNFKRAEGSVNSFSKSTQQKIRRIERAGRSMQRFGRSMLKNVTAPIAGALTGMVALAQSTANYADEIDKTSQRVNANVEDLQRLRYATEQLGMQKADLERALGRLNQRMTDASGEGNRYTQILQRLGVQTHDTTGEARESTDVFRDVVRSLSDLEDASMQARIAGDLFGTQLGRTLLPAIRAGGSDIDNLMRRADELGIVMSEKNVDAAVEYGDAINELRAQFGAITREIGMAFIPLLKDELIPFVQEKVIPFMRDKAELLQEWIEAYRDLPEPIKNTTKALGGLAAAIAPFAIAGGKMASMWGRVRSILLAVTSAKFAFSAATAGTGYVLYEQGKRVRELSDAYDAHLKREFLLQNNLPLTTEQFIRSRDALTDFIRATRGSTLSYDELKGKLEETSPALNDNYQNIERLTAAFYDFNESQMNVNRELERQAVEGGHVLWWYEEMQERILGMTEQWHNAATAAERFGEQMFHSSVVAGKGVKGLANDVIEAARQVVSAKLYEAIASVLADSFARYGIFGLAAASMGAAAVTGVFNSLIPSFREGGIVYNPTLAMIGDRPQAPEVVMGLDQLQTMVRSDMQVVITPRVTRGQDIEWIQERRASRRRKTM